MTSFSCATFWRTGHLARRALPVAALLVLGACTGMGEAMTAHTNVVARAAGKELRVDEAAQMLASNPQIPPDPQVVRALADLWVDYALLANAVAEDTTLAAVDLAGFVAPIREQTLVMRLREQVIQADTVFDEAELQRRWIVDGPSAEISARHILLRVPGEGTQAQRDSVRQLAESIRARAVGGESFEDLARQYSQDPGSAARGGDLGFFGRGRMVQPFEDAAFEMQAGEISPVVETPFGYHIIQVDERRQPPLADERDQFRAYLVQRSIQDAEGEYLDRIADEANIQVRPGGTDVIREIASRPEIDLRGRAADRAIATYRGGEYTARDFATFVRTQPPQVQSSFATATDEQLESAARQLVQMRLLLREAEQRGIALTAEEEEEIRAESRQMIRELVEATGFAEAARLRADPSILEAHVKALVEGIVSGEQPFVPLGQLGLSLRDVYPHEVNEGSFAAVVRRLEEIRARQPALPQLPGQFDPDMPMPGDPQQMPQMPPMPGDPQQMPPMPQPGLPEGP
jgi:peptidyl-prolyl cis-trans isomerase C